MLDIEEDEEALSAEIQAHLRKLEKIREAKRKHAEQVRKRKEEAERLATLEEAKRQSDEVSDEMLRLQRRYLKMAQGHVWFEGTGNDDAIMPHQMHAIMFGAAAKRWICGDEMGLGKTRQATGWLDLVEAQKVLIVCEAGVADQFAGEVMELAPHRSVYNLYKSGPQKRHEVIDMLLSKDDEAVIVVNYEIWRNDSKFHRKLVDWQFDTLIVDEAHNLKGTNTSNFQYIKALTLVDNVCGKCGGVILGLREEENRRKYKPCPHCGWTDDQPRRRVYNYPLDNYLTTKSVKNLCFLTGTPILNSPDDIYPLLHLCDPLLFKSRRNFRKTFCKMNHHSGKYEFHSHGLKGLQEMIGGTFLARTKKDVGINLPRQRRHVVRVDLDPEEYEKQYRVIRQLSESARIVLESGESLTIMHLIALITRKRQANVWPGGITVEDPETKEVIFSVGDEVQESVKLDVAAEKIMELHKQGKRQAVFSQFTTGINEFAQRLEERGLRVAKLTGKTPKRLRERIKTNFYRAKSEEPEWDIVLCNYKTGGTGLNLTSATATHIIDEEWNPGRRDQSYGRTDRIGQTEENDVYIYRIPASVDTWMSNIINRKEKMISEFNNVVAESPAPDLATSLLEAMKSGEVI